MSRDCGGNWDCPDALNTDELVEHIKVIKSGEQAQIPIYSFPQNARVKGRSDVMGIPNGAKGVLLVEGLMVLHDEALRRMIDIRRAPMRMPISTSRSFTRC